MAIVHRAGLQHQQQYISDLWPGVCWDRYTGGETLLEDLGTEANGMDEAVRQSYARLLFESLSHPL